MKNKNPKENKLEIIEEMQKVCAQMVDDDIAENPDIAHEFFNCGCCGKYKSMAGSIQYGDYRLCNDCVLFAEIGFGLKKLENISDLIEAMEEECLGEICEFIKQDIQATKNRLGQSE